MSNSIVLDTSTGIKTTTGIEGGKTHVRVEQDVTAYLKEAEKARFAKTGFKDATNGMYHRARIPLVALDEWRINHGFDWMKASEEERRKWMRTEHFKMYELRRG